MGLVKKGLFGKFAYQDVGLAGRSVGYKRLYVAVILTFT